MPRGFDAPALAQLFDSNVRGRFRFQLIGNNFRQLFPVQLINFLLPKGRFSPKSFPFSLE